MSNEKQSAEELYAHRRDPGEVTDEAEDIEARPVGSEMVSFRLPSSELDALEDYAQAMGVSISALIREALRERRSRTRVTTVVAHRTYFSEAAGPLAAAGLGLHSGGWINRSRAPYSSSRYLGWAAWTSSVSN